MNEILLKRIVELEKELLQSRANEAALQQKLTQVEGILSPFVTNNNLRMARCGRYGEKTGTGYLSSECNCCKDVCFHQTPSDPLLAFFESKPKEEFDKFYCGCHSWN